MNEWMKWFITALGLFLMPLLLYAQKWTVQDSLRLKKLLEGDRELKLNPEAVKSIDFGNAENAPRMSVEKSWLAPDGSLPNVLPKPKMVLTLQPYTTNVRYDWDPIYLQKVQVNRDTWRGDSFYNLRHQTSYSNWAQNPMSEGIRQSLDEIRSSGVSFKMLSERANGMMVNSVVMNPAMNGLSLGNGVSINGGTISGLDLMTVFTKDFWDKKGRSCRERTLEVLKAYGDTISRLIHVPIEQITR